MAKKAKLVERSTNDDEYIPEDTYYVSDIEELNLTVPKLIIRFGDYENAMEIITPGTTSTVVMLDERELLLRIHDDDGLSYRDTIKMLSKEITHEFICCHNGYKTIPYKHSVYTSMKKIVDTAMKKWMLVVMVEHRTNSIMTRKS